MVLELDAKKQVIVILLHPCSCLLPNVRLRNYVQVAADIDMLELHFRRQKLHFKRVDKGSISTSSFALTKGLYHPLM